MAEGRFTRKKEDFTCENCGAKVRGTGYTDHCTVCLYSKHVDVNPGDRKSTCRGMMKPVRAAHDRDGFVIYYECTKCGFKRSMKAAPNDSEEALNRLFSQGSAFI